MASQVKMSQTQSRSLLTRKEKIHLINGYTRQSVGNIIPSVLIELVQSFYNNLRSLRICDTNLKDFLYNGKPMVTEMFSITDNISYKDIKFRMGVYPNGLRRNKKDAIEFYIKLKSLHTESDYKYLQNHNKTDEIIDKMKIYYELYCQETECEWKGVIEMELNEYIVWSPYLMRISDCKTSKYKSLFFSVDITILSLYFKSGQQYQITKQVTMNKNEKFHWQIRDKNILYKLNHCKYGYCYFSDNFGGYNNDNWCCKYYPQGMKVTDTRGSLFIRLLRKPINVKTLKIKYQIEFNKEIIIEEIKTFSDTRNSNGYWLKKLTTIRRDNNIANNNKVVPINFNIIIDIMEVYDYNDKSIPFAQWMKYGVSRLKPF